MTGPPLDQLSGAAAEDFEVFFRREHPRLLGVAVAMVGDREAARDLTQEALLRAFHAWPKVRGLDSPGGWTRRVLVNLCVDTHRRKGSEQRALARSVTPLVVEPSELPSPTFWAAVRDLPRLQRSAVALHYVDDLSIAEVAHVLGVSTGSVKTSLSRARAALAETLSVHLTQEEQP
jgi:RNA polymerase sigma-70 factor (ECF subfamily)